MVCLAAQPSASLHVGVDAILSLKFVVVVAVSAVIAAVPQHLDDAVVLLWGEDAVVLLRGNERNEGLGTAGPQELRGRSGEGEEAGEENLERERWN